VILGLTVKELGVLTCLAARRGRILPREEIFARVWGWTMVDGDRTIDVYVRRLRAKLERASPGWSYIHTHKGRGYRFEASPTPPGSDTADPSAGEIDTLRARTNQSTAAPRRDTRERHGTRS
jgi:DNA-binding winged helix-turn-helix (wHTH) protein